MSPLWNASRHTLGVTELDVAHQEFAGLLAKLIESSDKDFPSLFEKLINHTRAHFNEEGQLMRASKYPGLSMHEGEHHRALGEMQQLNRSLKRGHLPLVRAFVKQGLPEWFDTHLAMMDGALAAHLKKGISQESPLTPVS
jgi:hemerythrin-like metal-binding protein